MVLFPDPGEPCRASTSTTTATVQKQVGPLAAFVRMDDRQLGLVGGDLVDQALTDVTTTLFR